MFLLNEIIEEIKNEKLSIDEMISFYDQDFESHFKKGDLVYFDDYELKGLFKFFNILNQQNKQYENFIDTSKLFSYYKPIFDYINCVGIIKSIYTSKLKVSKGNKIKKKYTFEIQYPNDKIVKISNINYLKHYF